jgi:hypothetical protein
MNYYPSSHLVSHTNPDFADLVNEHRDDFPHRPQRAPRQTYPGVDDLRSARRCLALIQRLQHVRLYSEKIRINQEIVWRLRLICPAVEEHLFLSSLRSKP